MVIVICCYVVVNFPPSSSPHVQVFLLFDSCERDIHRTTSPITLTAVFNISRITFTVLTFSVIVKEVLPKVLLQIPRKQ